MRRRAFVSSLALGWLVALGAAHAEERFAVVIGNNIGEAEEVPLKYAEADAARVAAVLRDIGSVRAENLVLLQGQNEEAVRRALIAINERIRAGRPANTTLIVYYSGHADAGALHLGDTTLSIDELRGLVQGSAATFRLSIVDACRSGGLTRVKGGTIIPRSTVIVRDDAVGEGTVFLTATSADENAQESDRIRGSFFTHYLVTGLLGAADDDRDGAVDLNEVYRFAYDNTLRASSRTLGGQQHPTFHQELRGKGEIVLTRWSAPVDRAFFTFPAGQSWLLIRGSEQGPIVAEVNAYSANRTIGVRPGRYYLMGRASNALLEGATDAGRGARIAVERLDLTKTDYARLVRKGGAFAPSVAYGVAAGYQLRSGLYADSGPCQGAYAEYAADWAVATAVGRVGYCAGRFSFRGNDGTADELDLGIRGRRVFDLGRFSIRLGIGAALAILRQRITLTDRAGDQSLSIREQRTTFGAHGDLSVGASYALPAGFFVGAEGHAMLYLFEVQQTDLDPGLELRFASRLSAMIGKRF